MNPVNPNVLIIDNDDAVVEALSIRLSNEDFTCYSANSGAQGIALFSDMEFHAVLTDLNMPSGDGVSVIESIRKTSDVPVLVITGFEADYTAQLKEYDNVFIIQKPFDLETLIDELEIAIGMSGIL